MSQTNNIQQNSAQITVLQQEAKQLLEKLIATPSFSKEEDKTADLIQDYLHQKKVKTERKKNNIWAINTHYDAAKPTLLLNSHHDTVKPNKGFTLDPFTPIEKEGKLYGLGSNDAGGCLVSLIATFLYYYDKANLPFNIILVASAEEEISGHDGIELVLPLLPKIDFGIVGEPTLMHLAIAERGLMVLDCIAHGKAGHAAREEGDNAIYNAMKDINWFKTYEFAKKSSLFGQV
jgi:acetylornithine deacetylase